MEITRFGPLTDEDRAQLEGDEPDPFDAAGIELTFRPKDRHVGIRDDGGQLIASAGFVLAEVEIDGRDRLEALQPRGTAVVPHLAMWRPLTEGRSWPPGPAVLQSLPF